MDMHEIGPKLPNQALESRGERDIEVAAEPGRQERRDGREPGQRMTRPADEQVFDAQALQSADEIADLPRAAVEVPAGFDVQHFQDGIT